jgi:hypothetical protein
MEELRSTEALDREILEDARKKAFRILKIADDTLAAQTQDWEAKTQTAIADLREAYSGQAEKAKVEILARLPLDKRRFRSETAEGFLVRAMDDFLRSLPKETLLSVLERELTQRLKACSGDLGETAGLAPRELFYSGISLSEARMVLEKALAAINKTPNNWTLKASQAEKPLPAAHEFPSIVIAAKSLKITASVNTAAAELLKDKRAELAAALLGEGVLND